MEGDGEKCNSKKQQQEQQQQQHNSNNNSKCGVLRCAQNDKLRQTTTKATTKATAGPSTTTRKSARLRSG
jgi:hypothetical protein